jgi:hypothetical protein
MTTGSTEPGLRQTFHTVGYPQGFAPCGYLFCLDLIYFVFTFTT